LSVTGFGIQYPGFSIQVSVLFECPEQIANDT
jgi:hypothetical protein